MLGFGIPAVELDNRLTVGPVIAVAIRDEEQVGRRADPDAAEAELDPGEVGPLVEKDRPPIEPAVVVGVFKDQDAVLALRSSEPDRIGIILDHPEPSPVIDGHGDRLDDVGFGGKKADRETLGHGDATHGVTGGQWGIRRGLRRGKSRPCSDQNQRQDQTPTASADRTTSPQLHDRRLLDRTITKSGRTTREPRSCVTRGFRRGSAFRRSLQTRAPAEGETPTIDCTKHRAADWTLCSGNHQPDRASSCISVSF